MTKRELLAALEPFGDDQYVMVCLFSRDDPRGSQVIIQGVASVPPWRDAKADGSTDLVGLVAHDRNSLVPTAGHEAFRSYSPHASCVEGEWIWRRVGDRGRRRIDGKPTL